METKQRKDIEIKRTTQGEEETLILDITSKKQEEQEEKRNALLKEYEVKKMEDSATLNIIKESQGEGNEQRRKEGKEEIKMKIRTNEGRVKRKRKQREKIIERKERAIKYVNKY